MNENENTNLLYVGNLHYRLNDQDLEQICAEFGEVVSARVEQDHETGRSRGFGYCEFANHDDAVNAASRLNGAEIEGKQLMVNLGGPRQPNTNFRAE